MRILIAIHGAHSQPEHMAAQRETWLKDLPQGVDYRYFVGLPASAEPDVETVDSPDGPIWQGAHRTMVLNRKTEALVKFAFDAGYDYVFKCDDDTYVFPDRLMASGFENFDYSGSMDWHWSPETGPYKWAQGGAGYWLSRRCMGIIAAEGLHLVRAEDFAAGQLLARHGIDAQHDPRYIPAATEADYSDPSAITLHKISPSLMRLLHSR